MAQTQQLAFQPAIPGLVQAGAEATERPIATTALLQPADMAPQSSKEKKKKRKEVTTADEPHGVYEPAAAQPQQDGQRGKKRRKMHSEDSADVLEQQQQLPAQGDAKRGSLLLGAAQDLLEAATEAGALLDVCEPGQLIRTSSHCSHSLSVVPEAIHHNYCGYSQCKICSIL